MDDHCEIYFYFYQSEVLSSVCALVDFVWGPEIGVS